MHLLVVAATSAEVAPLLMALGPATTGSSSYDFRGHRIEVLITGVGMVATAARVAGALASTRCAAALNLGVCGSFDRSRQLGTVVHVIVDGFPELGVEDGERFVSATAAGLVDPNAAPLTDGRVVNHTPPAWPALQALPTVTGVTVNMVHGRESSIAALRKRSPADVESMEGAAFLYACLLQQLPCAQVRAVSNHVERRNRAAWTLDDAVAALNATGLRILEGL
jgi:futalosine hydrolase